MNTVRLFIGFDPREAAAYHVCAQSIIERSSLPLAITPLHSANLPGFDGQKDGSNAFIYSRFLVPYLCDFSGCAIFIDGDMVVNADIAELWALRERFAMNKACAVVKHDYATQHPRKYLGTPLETGNESYPRKNWSIVILWNCGHYANRILTPELVAEASGKQVHRFEWLRDEQIDDLPGEWNHLVGEYPEKESKLYHFTLGVPGFERYARDEGAVLWHEARERMNHLVGV